MTDFTKRLCLTLCCIFTTVAASADVYYAKGAKVTTLESGKAYIIEGKFNGSTGHLYYSGASSTWNNRANYRFHSTTHTVYEASHVWIVTGTNDEFTMQSANGYAFPPGYHQTMYDGTAKITLHSLSGTSYSSQGDFTMSISNCATSSDNFSAGTYEEHYVHTDKYSAIDDEKGGFSVSYWGDTNTPGTGSEGAFCIYEATPDWQYSVSSLCTTFSSLINAKAQGQPCDDADGTNAALVAEMNAKAVAKTATEDDYNTLLAAYNAFKISTNLYLPSGYYYMKSVSDRPPYLFNAFQFSANTKDYTLQSSTKMAGNNGIWHIVNNGTSINITNGQGQGLNTDNGSFTSLNFVAANDMTGICFSEYPNASASGSTRNIVQDETTYLYVTTWSAGGATKTDNRWSFEEVSSPNIYDVVITGYSGASLTYSGNQYAKNGGFFNVSGTPTENDFSVQANDGYRTELTIDNDNKTVTVKYVAVASVTFVVMDETGKTVFKETLDRQDVGTTAKSTYEQPLYTTLSHDLTALVESSATTIYATIGVSESLPFTLGTDFNDATWYDVDGVTTEMYGFIGNPWNGIKKLTYSLGATQEGVDVVLADIEKSTYALHSFDYPHYVTYKYMHNGVQWGEETFTIADIEHSFYPDPTAPVGVSVSKPDGVVRNTQTRELECTLNGNLPFTFYDSYSDITNWYTMRISDSKVYLHDQGTLSYMTLDGAIDETSDETIHGYQFGFVGNPYAGYKIYNRADGEDEILSSPAPTYSPIGSSTTGQYAWPIMKDASSIPTGYNTLWDFATGTKSGSVVMARHGETVYCNKRTDAVSGAGNVLAFWTKDYDAGSCIYIGAAGDNPAEESKYVSPSDGKYYILENVSKGTPLTEKYLTGHNMVTTNSPDNKYSQYWKLEANESGKFALKNVLTNRYIQVNWSQSGAFSTGTSPYYFGIEETTEYGTTAYYFDDSRALHSDAWNSVVGWYNDNNASAWRFIEEPLSEAELNLAAIAYQQYEEVDQAYLTLKANEETYTTALETFFNDYACTELRDDYKDMTDDELTEAMTTAGLPTQIITMALKVKNDSWTQYVNGYEHLNEKFFRVQDYHIYSNENTWCGLLGASNARGYWSNPTGIVVPKSETAILYVGSEIPTGATLKLSGIMGTDTGKKEWTLHKGVNVIQTTETDRLFMYYMMDNTDASGNIQYLSNFDDITVHIEGGWVNGYWDGTREMDNEDWKAMIECEDLLTYKYMDIKDKYICMLMNTEKFEAACKTDITGLMRVWNHMVKTEYEVLGVYYKDNDFGDRFNNLMNGFSVTYNYMYASTWGGWYNEGTLSTIMNPEVMQKGGGALWGPAHEMGHNNQAAMNMIGCTEISNNVFSNAVVWQWGTTTTRGSAPAATFDKFKNGNCWYERELWERTRLYYQLWQYFYVCKHDEDFYPKLYRKLIESPMKKYGYNFCPAAEDELHFAEVVCEVAEMDLTEFFEVYGFFQKPTLTEYTISGTTKEAFKVSDYSDYYVTFDSDTQPWEEQVAATKAKLAAYENKAGANLMFIEDRIETTVSDDRTANPGVTRADYGSDVAVGKCGDVGSFTQFDVEATETGDPSKYYYTFDGSNITMVGSGAVGFKIYAKDGSLAILSNTNTFAVTQEIANQLAYGWCKVEVAKADGSLVELTDELNTANMKAASIKGVTDIADGVYTIRSGSDQYVHYSGTELLKGSAAQMRNQYEFTLKQGTGDDAGKYTIATCTGKLVTYTALSGTPITFTDEASATDDGKWWVFTKDDVDGEYDIVPYQEIILSTTAGWNFCKTVGSTDNAAIGLYALSDQYSNWKVTLASADNVMSDRPSVSLAPGETGFDNNTKWYTMRQAAAGYYISNTLNNEDATYTPLSTISTKYADADLWCFVLDEENGDDAFRIYNREAGVGYIFASETATSDNASTTYPRVMLATDDAAVANPTWKLTESKSLSETGFYLGQASSGYRVNRNNSSGKMDYWSGADAGSTIRIEYVSQEQLDARYSVAEGKYYRLHNVSVPTHYMYVGGDNMTELHTHTNATAGTNATYRNIWTLETTGTDKEYYIKNVYTGYYVAPVPTTGGSSWSGTDGVAGFGSITPMVTDKASAGKYTFAYNSTGFNINNTNPANASATFVSLHDGGSDGKVVRWNSTSENSKWIVEVVEEDAVTALHDNLVTDLLAAKNIVDNYVGEGVGKYTPKDETAYTKAINNVSMVIADKDNQSGYLIYSATPVMSDLVSLNMPEDGKIYRIWFQFSGKDAQQLYYDNVNSRVTCNAASVIGTETDALEYALWTCHKSETDGKYYFQNGKGKYLLWCDSGDATKSVSTSGCTDSYVASQNDFTIEPADATSNGGSVSGLTDDVLLGAYQMKATGADGNTYYMNARWEGAKLNASWISGSASSKYYDANSGRPRSYVFRMEENICDVNTAVAMVDVKSGNDIENVTSVDLSDVKLDGVAIEDIQTAVKAKNGNPNTIYYVANGTAVQKSSVNIAVKDAATNASGFTCQKLELTDGKPFAPEKEFIASASTYTRSNVTSTWGTICVPWPLKSDDNVQYYSLSSVSGSTLYLTKIDNVEGGKPAAFKRLDGESKADVTAASTEAATISGTPVSVDGGELNFFGTYTRQVITDADSLAMCYYISKDKFYRATKKITFSPFRAMFTYTPVTGNARASVFAIGVNEATEIEGVLGNDDEVEGYYDINGRKTEGLQNGVNIIRMKDGSIRKVIVR